LEVMSNTSEAMIRVFVLTLSVFAPNIKIAMMIKIFFIRCISPENDYLQFRFASPHQDKGMLPVPLQRLLVRGLRDVK